MSVCAPFAMSNLPTLSQRKRTHDCEPENVNKRRKFLDSWASSSKRAPRAGQGFVVESDDHRVGERDGGVAPSPFTIGDTDLLANPHTQRPPSNMDNLGCSAYPNNAQRLGAYVDNSACTVHSPFQQAPFATNVHSPLKRQRAQSEDAVLFKRSRVDDREPLRGTREQGQDETSMGTAQKLIVHPTTQFRQRLLRSSLSSGASRLMDSTSAPTGLELVPWQNQHVAAPSHTSHQEPRLVGPNRSIAVDHDSEPEMMRPHPQIEEVFDSSDSDMDMDI